jgi:hypothetical protein
MRAGLAVALALWAGGARAEAPLWTFGDADTQVTVLGSVHALPPGVPWRGPAVDRAIAQADVVVFEMRQGAPPAAVREAHALMAELGRARDGVALSDRLSAAGRERLARHAPAVGLAPGTLDGLQPWYVGFQLEWAGGRRDGARPELGVEAVVLAALRPEQRTEALEEPTDIVRILSGFPMADQVRMLEGLLEGLDAPDTLRRNARALEAAWAAGRTEAIAAESARLRAASPGVHARLVTERNRRWADQLTRLLDRPGRVLVVVGAGHMVGTEGLPALLRSRGVAVSGPR